MRLEGWCLAPAMALLLAAVSPGQASESGRAILFGASYLPQVTCVEDFSPYWITDNWTEKRMVTDLKIMKAMGCSGLRMCIFPAMPGRSTTPGIPEEKVLPMVDLAIKTAEELGLLVHFDIAQHVHLHANEGVPFYLNRYKGRIESYQIGNEQYGWPGDPKQLDWLQGLLETAHSIDPKVKISADILVPDWVKIRKERPGLYKQLDMGLAHYYSVTDYRGWNDIYIADLIDHLSNPTGRNTVTELSKELFTKTIKDFGEYDAKAESYDHPLYAGSWAWLDKEVWITEISTHGYWPWGNLVPEDKRASDWPKVVDAIAAADNRVTRLYHHCFRDKMSWREYGAGQSGIVYYDGAPRAATLAFKKMAVKYSPPESPLRALECEVPRVLVKQGANEVDFSVKLTNKTAGELKGEAVLELPDGAQAEDSNLKFSLPANGSKTWKVKVHVGGLNWGNNHAFVRIRIPQGLVYGWGIIAKPKRIELDTKPVLHQELSPKVKYVQGFEAVQEFFDKYGDDCAIITGPALGGDVEMGYRLKTVIQAMRCNEVPVKPSIIAPEVMNRPIIVIGTPEYNIISRTIEYAVPDDHKISKASPGPGKGLVQVIEEPLGKRAIGGRGSKQAGQVGYYFGGCPAALYIAGPDDDGTQAAAFDLILRIWGSGKKYE